MQNKINKRAMSNIVAQVILIGLSIIAIGIVFNLVIDTSKNVLTSPASCSEFQLSNPINIEKSCYNTTSNQTLITLKRLQEKPEISEIKFIFSQQGTTEEYTCSSNCLNCKIPKALQQQIYYFNNEIIPEEGVLYLNNCELVSFKIKEC